MLFPDRSGKVPVPDQANYEGGPSYAPSLREAVAEVLMMGTFGNSFYVSDTELTEQALDLLEKGVDTDPEFTAKAIVVARTEGYVRSAPLLGLVLLTNGNDEAKNYAKTYFQQVIRTADDLRNFVAICKSGAAGVLYGGLRRRLVANWLNDRLTEYQAIKYAGVGDQYSLRNILRLTHPATDRRLRSGIYRWLTSGFDDDNRDQTEFHRLSGLADLIEGKISPAKAIADHGLPFEAVMPRVDKGDKEVWAALLDRAPYMFLLRSLNAMHRAGVFEDKTMLDHAIVIVSDQVRIKGSMLFPFRFSQAIDVLQNSGAPQPLINAVARALEFSVDNVPRFNSNSVRMAIGVDVSWSMSGHSNPTPAEIAGVFAAALWKANPDATLIPFSDNRRGVIKLRSSPLDSIQAISREIKGKVDGGTDLGLPIRQLMNKGQVVDLFVGVTDSEDWAGEGFLTDWQKYTKRVASNAKAVLIQVAPTGHRVAPEDYPDVHYVYGWSDQVLRYVAMVGNGQTFADLVMSNQV